MVSRSSPSRDASRQAADHKQHADCPIHGRFFGYFRTNIPPRSQIRETWNTVQGKETLLPFSFAVAWDDKGARGDGRYQVCEGRAFRFLRREFHFHHGLPTDVLVLQRRGARSSRATLCRDVPYTPCCCEGAVHTNVSYATREVPSKTTKLRTLGSLIFCGFTRQRLLSHLPPFETSVYEPLTSGARSTSALPQPRRRRGKSFGQVSRRWQGGGEAAKNRPSRNVQQQDDNQHNSRSNTPLTFVENVLENICSIVGEMKTQQQQQPKQGREGRSTTTKYVYFLMEYNQVIKSAWRGWLMIIRTICESVVIQQV